MRQTPTLFISADIETFVDIFIFEIPGMDFQADFSIPESSAFDVAGTQMCGEVCMSMESVY
jgi:hypothetical protein